MLRAFFQVAILWGQKWIKHERTHTHCSIYDNITYGLEEGEFSEEDVYDAARMACAHTFITEFAGKEVRRGG